MHGIFSRIKISFKIADLFDRDTDKFELRPRRAWAIVFSGGILLIVLILAIHAYEYAYIRTDGSLKQEEGVKDVVREVKLNKKGLAEIISIFEEKNAQFQNLVVSPVKIADPSAEIGGQNVDPTIADTTAPTQKNPALKKGNNPAPVLVE